MSQGSSSLPRLGLVGTGDWARRVHAPSAAASEDVRFVSVYGRDQVALGHMRSTYGVATFVDYREFLAEVDIVAFAVPPDVQAGLAILAAASRKHLLLEKPATIDPTAAWDIADTLSETRCFSVVSFTHLLRPSATAWVENARLSGDWLYARSESFARALVDSRNPSFKSLWRREKGALWDTAPHAIAVHCRILGDVVEVTASAGTGRLTSLTLLHVSGTLSNVTVTLEAPAALPGGSIFFGTSGAQELPKCANWESDAKEAHLAALGYLGRAWRGDPSGFAPDACFGAHVTSVIDAAERSIQSGCRERPQTRPGSFVTQANR